MRNKSNIIALSVVTAIFGIATIVCGIFAAIEQDSSGKMFLLILTGAGALCVILMVGDILMNVSRNKKYLANVNNPDTIAHKVMGEGTKFDHYVVVPNAAGQAARNAAVNTVGVLSAVFLGAGVISYGKTYLDVFVSEDELIVNGQKNPTYQDSEFMRYPSQLIEKVDYISKMTCERVVITVKGMGNQLNFDVSKNSKTPAEKIHNSFNRLLHSTQTEEIARPAPDVFTEFKEDAQTAAPTDIAE